MKQIALGKTLAIFGSELAKILSWLSRIRAHNFGSGVTDHIGVWARVPVMALGSSRKILYHNCPVDGTLSHRSCILGLEVHIQYKNP